MKITRSLLAGAALLALPSFAQQPPAAVAPHGKVLYARSGQDAARTDAAATGAALVSTITDASRAAVTFTRYALDLHLRPAEHAIAARARITVRNDGAEPLGQLPLQVSSTLSWDDIRIGAAHARFTQATLASDVDHTGQLHEVAIALPAALAPGASLDLDVLYSGTIAGDATRLEQIGTPHAIAQRSDWDQVSGDFVGLRGFGNVAWYPVASVPVRLGDGDKLFALVGATRQRQQSATVSITLTAEVTGPVPTVAILNGTIVPVTVTLNSAGTASETTGLPSIVKAEMPASPLRFQTLSLFLAARQKQSGNAIEVYARLEDAGRMQPYLAAGSMVTPLLRTWLQAEGADKPRAMLALLDLANAGDAPFEERQTLFTGLQPVNAEQLTSPMSHALTHAYFQSPRPWLNEGVAHFIASLWTEQAHDRDAALRQLEDQRPALALAEPDTDAAPPSTPGDGLVSSAEAIFYRTKATYVFWMLRAIVGDTALQNALKLYDPAQDSPADPSTRGYFEQLLARTSVAQPQAKELHPFFEDWVYNDHGLPELSITGAYPSQAGAAGAFLVAVDVQNNGGACADVPVTVSSIEAQVSERLFVPAHSHAVRRLLIHGEPTQVQVNDGTVPETVASVHVQQLHYTAAKP